jgi:hypothetical protein
MTVTLRLSPNDYSELLIALGYAIGAAVTVDEPRVTERFRAIAHVVVDAANLDMNATQSSSKLEGSKSITE